MSLPGNGIFVVQGEMNILVTAMRRSTRWGSHSFLNEEYDVLMRTFQDLKTVLNQVDDLRLLDPATYLGPFLEVIRSKETTGPVTSLALSAIHKFLSYGLIDPTHPSVPATVEDIAEAVTHARFVGTDHSSDGVVLMKILQVLRTLMLSPEGVMLTDESVCEIMLSCFRICFETRLTELLRRNAEQCLRDMTQLIFMRLPQFPPEDAAALATLNSGGLSLKKRERLSKRRSLTAVNSNTSLDGKSSSEQTTAPVEETENDSKTENLRHSQDKNLINEAEITIEPVDVKTNKHARHSSMDLAANDNTPIAQLLEKCVSNDTDTQKEPSVHEEEPAEPDGVAASKPPSTPPLADNPTDINPTDINPTDINPTDINPTDTNPTDINPTDIKPTDIKPDNKEVEEYVNHRGIRFRQSQPQLQPYSLFCVRELFRFLISLSNPLEAQNTSAMVHLGLTLVGTALEVAADSLPSCPSLLALIKDQLCRNLLMLLSTERISIFALDLQVSFLLFEAMRFHLKFQMEAFFKKLIEIISADTSKAIYELKEIHHLALESLIQFFRIPGLCTELYLNYDCDVYCMNVFEEVTKLLSKNVVSSTAYEIHQLSLEALLTIQEAIELGVTASKEKIEEFPVLEEGDEKYGRGGHVTLELGGMDDSSVVSDHVTHDISQYFTGARQARHKPSADVPTEAELDNVKNMKKWVTQGTELFNQKPERGIEFLQEHGVLKTPLDPHQVALFLRENPDLDKKMIGEYICKRSSRGEEDDGPSVLGAFADSFEYKGLRIDQALRLYLETFRLPGEAPLIFLVMERFAERWHSTNGEPFANTDAAFRLAYAVIMLNMDQHNHNAKKLNVPMTVEDFVKNLRGCNGSGDFEQGMLEQVFHSIKNEEMVMPAERVGPVRDAYLWRVLQRRGGTPGGRYRMQPSVHPHHARLFTLAAPPALSALSAAFERAAPPTADEVERGLVRDSPALTALQGLERAAALTARLPTDALTLDSLTLTLCKFTGLLAPPHAGYIAIGVSLGQSLKAQAALRRACAVAARHAHALRDSWRHLLEIVNTLYIGLLLPKSLTDVEDYLSPTGVVSLAREPRGNDAGLLSSIYSYIALGETGIRAPTPHEKALIDAATECVAKCNLPGLLITETKFLQVESLQELIRAMVQVGTPPDADSLQLNPQLEDITIFFLELLGQTLVQNRDRLSSVWDEAGSHMQRVTLWAATRSAGCLTRALTALLRTAARLLRCHQCAPQALQHGAVLFALPYKLFYQQAVVISCGVYELVKTSAQNVHSGAEWDVVFALLCAAGAGAWPVDRTSATVLASTSSRSEGSEEESERRPTSASSESELSHSPQAQGWIMVKNSSAPSIDCGEFGDVRLRPHRTAALVRCCEALALVIRDVAHVTPHNCRAAVRAVRIFARATLHAGKKSNKSGVDRKSRPSSARRRRNEESSDEEIDTLDQYHMVSIQLLDLMHTLHSRAAQIFKWWRDEAEQEGAEEYDLWDVAWMPLLQGIAQFCTDRRKQVANSAIAYLQRALLAPGLTAMAGGSWEACFYTVLFPLMEQLPRRADATARANTIMCKVFLQHLSALSPRPSFGCLWLQVIAVQRELVSAPRDDALTEAALESLKNMILVMDSVRIFRNGDGYNELWHVTWSHIEEFLPTLKDELFPEAKTSTRPANLPPHMQPPMPASLPTIVPVNSNHPHSPYPHMSPVNISQTPPLVANLVAPIPLVANVLTPSPLATATGALATPMGSLGTSVGSSVSPVSSMTSLPTAMGSVLTPVSLVGSVATSIGSLPTSASSMGSVLPPTGLVTPTQAPGSLMNPGLMTPAPSGLLATPTPVSGMVPIRNSLYDQTGHTSVLLQPLNEMKSTPIGVALQTPMPMLYPQTEPNPAQKPQEPPKIEPSTPPTEHILQQTDNLHQLEKTEPYPTQIEPYPAQIEPYPAQKEPYPAQTEPYPAQIVTTPNILDLKYDNLIPTDVEQGELYAEYLTNPYEVKDLSSKEATIYDPNDKVPLIEKQKSYSENTTPQHTLKAQFGSTDNVRQESSIFNFASYFGAVSEKSAEFDSLVREG